MSTYPYLVTGRSASVRIAGRLYQLDASSPGWDKLTAHLRLPEHDSTVIRRLADPRLIVTKKGGGAITIDGSKVRFKGRFVPPSLSDKLLDVLDSQDDLLPWLAFAGKVMTNPVASAREELHLFMTEAQLPLTIDGDLMAYKKVNRDYSAVHGREVLYEIGTVTQMDRKQANPDRSQLCSSGLHFCSRGYLQHFQGARTLTVKINPADVVAIPSDYNNAKGRAWRIETVGELVVPTATSYDADEHATQAEGLVKAPVVSTTLKNPSVTTIAHGVLTRNKLIKLRKEHGSWSGVAGALEVGTGTVAAWVSKLGLVAKPRS